VRGTVVLGILAHAGSIDVLRILQEVRRDYPDVIVKLRQTVQGTRTSLEDLRSGALDLALVSVPEQAAAGLDLHPPACREHRLCLPGTPPPVRAEARRSVRDCRRTFH
jgi:DNA-binding transcriptional LysR family regulator